MGPPRALASLPAAAATSQLELAAAGVLVGLGQPLELAALAVERALLQALQLQREARPDLLSRGKAGRGDGSAQGSTHLPGYAQRCAGRAPSTHWPARRLNWPARHLKSLSTQHARSTHQRCPAVCTTRSWLAHHQHQCPARGPTCSRAFTNATLSFFPFSFFSRSSKM